MSVVVSKYFAQTLLKPCAAANENFENFENVFSENFENVLSENFGPSLKIERLE